MAEKRTGNRAGCGRIWGTVDDLRDRLTKLEESQAFSERAAEQMHGELIRAFEEIEKLRHRLAALEQRPAAPPAEEIDEGTEEFR